MQAQSVILDLLKPVGTVVDLSDKFNARVGDSMTPFNLFVTEGGKPKALNGLHPELEAAVGDGELKDGKVVMSDNAKGVHWVGSTNNVTGYNRLTLAFPAEVFPQSGFCYGHLILANDTGVRESSVDIWFKVLDGTPLMGLVADHYDSELQLELAKAKNANDQFSQEMRNTYNQQVTDAQNALTRATSNLSSLAAIAGNVESQIDAQDIVKRSEFSDLSQQVTNRLLSFDNKPLYYTNVDEIKSSNPSGSDRICIALDTKHRWIYTNGAWQDCGAAKDNTFEAARDASQDVMFGQEITDWSKGDKGTIVRATEDFANFENKPIMHLQSTNTNDYVYIVSDVVPVSGHVISVQFPEMIRNLSRVNTVSLEIRQLTPTDNPNNISTFTNNSIWLHFGDSQMTLFKATNLKLNDGTDRIQLVFQIHDDIGDAYVGKPVVNYGSQCIPYSPLQHVQDAQIAENSLTNGILNASQNLMYNQTIENWTPHVQGTAVISDDPNVQFANTPIMHIESSKADQTSGFVSSPVLVDEKIISVQLPEMIVGQDFPNSHVYISIFPLAEGESVGEQAVNQKAISFPLGNSTMGLSKFENIKLPDGTKKIVLGVNQDGIGHLFFGVPAVNYGPKCIAYSPSFIASDLERLDKRIDTNFKLAQMNSQNLLYGQDIRNWSSDVQGEVSLATEADKQFNETPIMHIKGTATGQNNNWISSPIEINNDVISLQLPQMSENEVFGQSNVYLSLLPMAEGENFTDDSVNKKVIAYTLGNSSLSLSKFENIKLPADTKRLVIRFTQQGIGDLYFGIPVLNYGSSCISYNAVQLGKNIDRSDAVVPQLYISADSSRTGYDKTPVSFKLVRKSDIDYGYLNFDIQGDSSRGYPKKNFKIKLFNDPAGKSKLKMRLFPNWQKTNKYNIKANWIDATQARNVVNAQLIKDAFATTGVDEQSKKLLESEDLGQINGVPIEVYFNGAYYGLCTLNTKKDELTFGMDSKDMTNDVLSTELAAKDFMNSSKKVDGNDWSSEIHDDASDAVKAGLASLQNFVTTSTDADFKAKLQDYIDVKSVMIEVLYGWLSCEGDYYSKSELLATWNGGKHWCLVPYDLDTTWGLTWNGANVDINDSWFSFSNANADSSAITHSGNLLHERIIKLFSTELKVLAQQLRASVWSNQKIIEKFKTFMDSIPESAYKRDHERWSEIPSLKTTDFKQIQSAVIQRGQEFDDFLNKI